VFPYESLTVTIKRFSILITLIGCVAVVVWFRPYRWAAISPLVQKTKTRKTVSQPLEEYGSRARARLLPYFKSRAVSYPPAQVVLVGLKHERMLEVHAAGGGMKPTFIRGYPILGLSGQPGPKLREGDRQVPEGIYPIESLNPNSRFHLALRVGYPNAFDLEQAKREGRTNLGGDIMIHGSSVSIGCLAMGDEASEDLFVLVADTGLKSVTIILSPVDFRLNKPSSASTRLPPWSDSLYASIKEHLGKLQGQSGE